MNLGNQLFHARKKCGLSQEAVAEKLGVSRQTISKWETNETIPDIYQSKYRKSSINPPRKLKKKSTGQTPGVKNILFF